MKTKFTKIIHYGEEITNEFKKGEVGIEEKIDGSQFRIYVNNGKVECGSKQVDWTDERPPDKMFHIAVEQATKIFSNSDLEDTMIYCEYLRQPKHNTLCYGRTPENNLIIFDVCIKGNFLNFNEKLQFSKKYGLEVVPILWKGKGEMIDMELIQSLLQCQSILGKEKIEGMVFKNYSKLWQDGYQAGKLIMLKYVREDFKERNAKEWKASTKAGFMMELIESLRTEARWKKAVQHVRDKGELEKSPKDIGKLMKELVEDVEAEEGENIKKELWKFYWKEIKKGITRGFPEWYKKYLAEEVENENK